MQLISSSIIPASVDDFWKQPEQLGSDLLPRAVLVLSQPFQAGSAEEETLLKMLGACKLAPDGYHILQLEPGSRIGWPQLREQLQPRYVLLLGINPAQLGLSVLFRFNETNSFNGCLWIPTASVSDLNSNATLKAQFWNQALKPTFVP